MLASDLFYEIEKKVPQHLALKNDKVGYFGPDNPDEIEINKVQVLLDIMPDYDPSKSGTDLVVCHHPPLFKPEFPVYVAHSNWDIVKGGANDALAECLKLWVLDVFDKETGVGRICSTVTTFKEFIKRVGVSLPIKQINIINNDPDKIIKKVVVVSGFGLKNPEYIKLSHLNQVDLFLSGDINHHSALLAKSLGISVVDASHYATEVPGLIKLSELVSEMGVETELVNGAVPWKTVRI